MDFDTFFSAILAALPIAAAIGCSVFMCCTAAACEGASVYGIHYCRDVLRSSSGEEPPTGATPRTHADQNLTFIGEPPGNAHIL
jgi:hypothetical protein